MAQTILGAMMRHNGLGASGNRRSIQAHTVRVNGELIRFTDTIVLPGDSVTIGKRNKFTVPDSQVNDELEPVNLAR